jgi:tRNA wybutosine-synthesizing protein 4
MAKRAIQQTASDAAISKLSSVNLGYYDDPFIQHFVPKQQVLRRAPLINRGYFARVQALDLIVARFLGHGGGAGGAESKQIVVLGAGCDTTFFRLQAAARHPRRYIELDVAAVAATKLAAIVATPALHRPLGFESGEQVIAQAKAAGATGGGAAGDAGGGASGVGGVGGATGTASAMPGMPPPPPGGTRRPAAPAELHVQRLPAPLAGASMAAATGVAAEEVEEEEEAVEEEEEEGAGRGGGGGGGEYHLVAADLRDVKGVAAALARAGFDPSLPTLFVSECVLIYLDAELSAPLLKWAAAACKAGGGGGAFVTYEQLRPHDPFGRTMVGHLERRGCALKSLEAYPLPSAQRARFEAAGWERARCRDMNSTYYGFLPPALVAGAARREIFDEVEEWHLIQAHYGLVVATVGGDAVAGDKAATDNAALVSALGFFEEQDAVDDDDGAASVPASAGRFVC